MQKLLQTFLSRFLVCLKNDTIYFQELISQRRRWLNGSFFAAVHSVSNFWIIFRANHSEVRKLFFLIQVLYMIVNLSISWFGIANYYIVFHFIFNNREMQDSFYGNRDIVFVVLNYVYIASMMTLLILAFGKKNQGTPRSR